MKLYDTIPEAEYIALSQQRLIIREINRLLLRMKDEKHFLNEVCNILVNYNSARYVWIALLGEKNGDPKVKFIAQAGFEESLMQDILAACVDLDRQNGPGYSAIMTRKAHVQNELDGCQSRIVLPLVDRDRVIGLLIIGSLHLRAFGDDEIDFLTEVAGDIVVGYRLQRMESDLRKSAIDLEKTLENTIEALTMVLRKRDPYTASHQQRVSDLACAIGQSMNLIREEIEGIRIAGMLHDIGKVYVPAEILSKPSKLTEGELNIMRTHPQVGYDIVKTLPFSWPIAPAVLQHHERMNATGYPSALAGEAISREARILAVADVVEAMSSHRPYRPALGLDKALAEIDSNKGILYDINAAAACLRIFEENKFAFA